jgi:hypothetical protein
MANSVREFVIESLRGFWNRITEIGVPHSNLTASIPYGFIDATSTSTVMTAAVNGITELRNGVIVVLTNNVIGSAAGYTININELGAKPVYYFYDDTTQSSSDFTVGKTCMFVYDTLKVSGGCWNMMYPFSPNSSSSAYLIRHHYSTRPLATALGRYRLLFTSPDGSTYVPANSSTSTSATTSKTVTAEKIDPFGEILYYNTTTTKTANQTPSTSILYIQMRITIGYSFNRTNAAATMTTSTPVYIKCTPQADGSAIIDPDTPYVQSLPSTEDGKIYIFLGVASSATQVELLMNHPVYQFKNGRICLWTNVDNSAPHISQISSSTLSQEIADNEIYNAGTLTSLTITLPNTITADFISQVNFTSGSTATVFTAPNTILWCVGSLTNSTFTPSANKRYTIMFYSDGVNVIGIVQGFTITSA